MKTVKLTEEAWKILSEYKLIANLRTYSGTIEYLDILLDLTLPNDHVMKRKSNTKNEKK